MKNEITINPLAKGLIFDIDGTICDTMPVHFIAWRQTAAEHGIEFTPENFVEVIGVPAFQTSQFIKAKFKADFDEMEFTLMKEERYEQNMHKAKPIEPVVKIIRENKGKLLNHNEEKIKKIFRKRTKKSENF